MALGGETAPSAHQKKSFHTIKVPQRTTSGETPFRQANSNNALALCFRAEPSGLCDMWLPYSTARQPAGLPTSFLELFSFWQRKKWNVSPFQRDEFLQNSVTGKIYLFFPFEILKNPNRQKKSQRQRRRDKNRFILFISNYFSSKILTASDARSRPAAEGTNERLPGVPRLPLGST